MTDAGPAMAWCPFPDVASARAAAKTLLDEQLVACANIIPAIQSLFIWDGASGEAQEAGMLVKTDASLLDRAVARLAQLHPYAQPAVLGWRCDAATAETASWLGALRG